MHLVPLGGLLETGIPADELFNNPDRDQNINNGLIIGLGAVMWYTRIPYSVFLPSSALC